MAFRNLSVSSGATRRAREKLNSFVFFIGPPFSSIGSASAYDSYGLIGQPDGKHDNQDSVGRIAD